MIVGIQFIHGNGIIKRKLQLEQYTKDNVVYYFIKCL